MLGARTSLFRNYDQEFEQLLSRSSAERRIPIYICLRDIPFGFSLTFTDEEGLGITVNFARDKELARTEQRAGIEAQLAKLGGTILVAKQVTVDFTDNWFIPSSVLADMRRTAVEAFGRARKLNVENSKLKVSRIGYEKAKDNQPVGNNSQLSSVNIQLSYLANVANHRAADFYRNRGAVAIAPAYELDPPRSATLMFCRHCLRYAMGWCPHRGGKPSPYREPYTLVSADGKRFALAFDCKQCVMMVKEKG